MPLSRWLSASQSCLSGVLPPGMPTARDLPAFICLSSLGPGQGNLRSPVPVPKEGRRERKKKENRKDHLGSHSHFGSQEDKLDGPVLPRGAARLGPNSRAQP